MQSTDIISRSDNRSKNRVKSQHISARLYKVDGNTVLYTVTSGTHTRQYLVKIKLLNLTEDRLSSFDKVLNGDIQLSCTCLAHAFMGYKYILYKNKAGIDVENRPPDKTNPERHGMACKHILAALDQMKSDHKEILDAFKRQFDAKKSKENSDKVKPTTSDKESTLENDLSLISKFRDECNKLYADYSKYLKSNPSDDSSFLDSEFYDKVDPSTTLNSLSKDSIKLLNNRFIGKLKSIDSILSFMQQKKNGFNVLLDSDVSSIIKSINSSINSKTESLINDIILNLIDFG